jgi:hypothetical protein
MGKMLTHRDPAAPPLQVLMVMKDGALRTAAKKVLEEINYKGSFPVLSPRGRHPVSGIQVPLACEDVRVKVLNVGAGGKGKRGQRH